MKKIIFGLAIATCALSANASYLFWQVTGNESWTDTPGMQTGASTLAGALGSNAMPAYDSYGFTLYTNRSGDWAAETSYNVENYDNGNKGDAYTPTSFVGTKTAYIDVGDVADSASFSYYIEIQGYTYGSQQGSVIAQSSNQDWSYANNSSMLMSDLSSMAQASVSAMMGSSYAAPEPTSGLLLLLGGALLALKRRRA